MLIENNEVNNKWGIVCFLIHWLFKLIIRLMGKKQKNIWLQIMSNPKWYYNEANVEIPVV